MQRKKIREKLSQDPKLRKIIANVGDIQIRTLTNPYEALVDSVITQQISDAAGMSIAQKFRALFGKKYPLPEDILAKSDQILLSSGITRAKLRCIKDISKRVLEGDIEFQKFSSMDDEKIISELVEIKGIGRWTAEMFLIFGLGRLDIMPLGDLGLKRGIQKMYSFSELPTNEKILKISSKWRPYRTVATWYIWKGIQNFKNV